MLLAAQEDADDVAHGGQSCPAPRAMTRWPASDDPCRNAAFPPGWRRPEVSTAVDVDRTKVARVARLGASALLVVAIFWFVLPQVADLDDVAGQVRAMTALELATLALAAGW